MASTHPTARYAPSQRWMHWLIFALVLLAYLCINLFDLFPKGSPARANIRAAHFTAGLAVLLLVLPRWWLRLRHGRPPIAPAPPRLIVLLRKTTHVALYAFLLIQPLLGVIMLELGGGSIHLFGVTVLPALVGQPHKPLAHQLQSLHVIIGTVFYYVIGLHILAGLWHHFYRHDNTLTRMI